MASAGTAGTTAGADGKVPVRVDQATRDSKYTSILRITPLGAFFDDNMLSKLAAKMSTSFHATGTTIHGAGDRADYWGVICKGKAIKVTAADDNGLTSILCTLAPGDIFGADVVHGKSSSETRQYTLKACADVEVLQLGRRAMAAMQTEEHGAIDLGAVMEALRLTRAYDVLKSMDMFKGVTKHNLEMFADMVHIRGVRAGETAVKEGDTGKSLYIVERGELEARSGNLVLSTIKPGQCFGEIAMMMQIPRTSTVVSTKACILYGTLLPQLFATDFDRFMQVDSVVHKYVASKTKDTIARQFRKYSKSFFDALSDEILDEVSKVSKVEVFQAGDCIFKEGDESDRFFMIADGAVSITSSKGVATKREKGSYFGEVGLMVKGDTKRKAAVTAVCRSLFLTIDRENFNRLFNRPDCLAPDAFFDLTMAFPKIESVRPQFPLQRSDSRKAVPTASSRPPAKA